MILITGATGTNGQELIRQLQSAFIQAAQRARLKHLVKFSAMAADSRANIELLRLHGETDDLLRRSGLPFTSLVISPAARWRPSRI